MRRTGKDRHPNRKAERELKLLKSKRKSLIEQLRIKGLEFITEKVTTAYKTFTK